MTFAGIVLLVDGVFFCCLALVAIIATRRRLAHWSFAAGMAALAVESAFSAFSLEGSSADTRIFWERLRWYSSAFVPCPWLVFSVSYSRGNYREFLKKWLPALALFAVVPLVLALALSDHLVIGTGHIAGSNTTLLLLGWPGIGLNLLNLFASVLVLTNLERTFHASVGTMRWRIKYLVIGMAVLFGARIYADTDIFLFSGVSPISARVEAICQFVACSLITFSLARSRLSSVDVYPSQAVLRGSLTVLLVGCYLFVVGLLAKVVKMAGGERGFDLVALVVLAGLVGLSALLLSDRLRQRLKRTVSTHFRRPLYDYRKVWAAFNERAVSQMNDTELCRETAKLVAETFEALSVTIWLMDEENREVRFAASTILSQTGAGSLEQQPDVFEEIVAVLRRHGRPFDIDSSSEGDFASLKRLSPDCFPKGGHRICVPLIAGGQLTGVMTLGDRVAGAPFFYEEMDLLNCIGGQVAAGLRSVKLSQRLLQAKELEAFQTMSAFFVHDLKNTASSLSLTLQNLPKHFDDPLFRQDALQAVSRSVGRINDLIDSLSVIRQELKADLQETDLNQVVARTLESLESVEPLPVVRKLNPLPRARLDPELMQKLITNLVLNARDALGKGGQIEVHTRERNGWIVLSVTDNGCGMSPEYVHNSLFRPFQTTKKKGIGIGVFHTKRIVEAHKGRIGVETSLGKGTTFRVFLPATGAAT